MSYIKGEDVIEKCYQKSIELLKKNSTEFGLLASTPNLKSVKRNYDSIFTRDACISVMGLAASKDKNLISIARHTLTTIARFQAGNGQIPNYVKPESKEVDYFYLGCLDATLWWLIALQYFDKNVRSKTSLIKKYKDKVIKALDWLMCQEHQSFFLLMQNETSDWADIMPRSGFVLYSNALWYEVKKLYKLKNCYKTKKYFKYTFDPNVKIPKKITETNQRFGKLMKKIPKQKKEALLYSYVSLNQYGNEGDVFGNLLACLAGVVSKQKSEDIIKQLLLKKVHEPLPVKTVVSPIKKNSQHWKSYMDHHRLNLPNQYHNGGSWPFIGGFWCIVLGHFYQRERAEYDLCQIAKSNVKNNWEFNEWMHGKTGKPMGMKGQSWNAAMFILAYRFLYKV